MPIIPALWEAQAGWIMRSRDRDHPGQHGETPVSTKNTKISQVWWPTPKIPATLEAEAGELTEWEAEVAVSQDRTIVLQLGQQE